MTIYRKMEQEINSIIYVKVNLAQIWLDSSNYERKYKARIMTALNMLFMHKLVCVLKIFNTYSTCWQSVFYNTAMPKQNIQRNIYV